MKNIGILAVAILFLTLTGCGSNTDTVSSGQTKEPAENSGGTEELFADEIQISSGEVDGAENAETVNMSIYYWYDEKKMVPVSIYILTSSSERPLFIKSGDLLSSSLKGSREKGFDITGCPVIGKKEDHFILTEANINDIRKSYLDFYNNDIYPIQDKIDELFEECSQIYAEKTENDDYLTDFTEEAPKELTMAIDGSPINMGVEECKVYVCGSTADLKGTSTRPIRHHPDVDTYLSAISLNFKCRSEDLDVFSDYISGIEEENKTLAEEIDPASVTIEEVLTFEPAVAVADEALAGKETSGGEEGTGIVGTWYAAEESDIPDFYMQINEDGTGMIHSFEDYQFTYTFSDDMLTVKISDWSPAYYHYYDGLLYADGDGSIYSKVKGSKKLEPNPDKDFDIIGIWYDPTGYSTASFTYKTDGTGILDWGSGAAPTAFTYSISGGKVIMKLPRSTWDINIIGDRLVDVDGSYYVRK